MYVLQGRGKDSFAYFLLILVNIGGGGDGWMDWMDILPGGGLREAEFEVYYDSYNYVCGCGIIVGEREKKEKKM